MVSPVGLGLLDKCGAVLRIPGESRGADIEMAKAKEMGKIIFTSIEDIPTLNSGLYSSSSPSFLNYSASTKIQK